MQCARLHLLEARVAAETTDRFRGRKKTMLFLSAVSAQCQSFQRPIMRTTLAVLVLLGVVGCQTRNVTTAPSPVKASAVAREAGSGPTGRSLQMVVVITDDWDAIPGVMRRYERDGVRTSWRAVGRDVPVVVGAAGRGWGEGLQCIGSAVAT